MTAELCAVILAAGEGTRLRPLTERVPKALCPVGNVPLLDLALARVAALGFTGPRQVAVNACYLADQVVESVGDRAHLSVEPGPRALGTAGGLARLRDWIAGRGVLVGNADAYLAAPFLAGPIPAGHEAGADKDLEALLDGWDGINTRLLGVPTVPDEWSWAGRYRFAGFSLLPWSRMAGLTSEPAELVRTVWRPAEAAGELSVIEYTGTFLDTGTPNHYLAANLHAAGPAGLILAPGATITGTATEAVIGTGARVEGTVRRCVVWPGAHVRRDEHLIDAIRYGESGTVPAEG